MLRSVVRRPSPATIIALLVLVVIAAPHADAAQKAVSSPKAQSAAEKKKKSTKAVEKAKYADNAGKRPRAHPGDSRHRGDGSGPLGRGHRPHRELCLCAQQR